MTHLKGLGLGGNGITDASLQHLKEFTNLSWLRLRRNQVTDTGLAHLKAVIGGLTYNFLPFMVLPIYVSLEKIDQRLVGAAMDLYATPARAFRRVTLPLSLPGVFAGTLPANAAGERDEQEQADQT